MSRQPSPGTECGSLVFGFDGFVDNVRRVGTITEEGSTRQTRTLGEFGDEIVQSAADNSSLAIPWDTTGQRTGGHVCHLSRVFQQLGFDPTMIGMCGDPVLDVFRAETAVLSEVTNETGDTLLEDSRAAFEGLGVDRFVGHSLTESVVVTDAGTTTVAVSPVGSPALTTSSGDHFNAGVALGLVEDLPDGACVVLGNALAREFVATGETPTYDDVLAAVENYTDQFE